MGFSARKILLSAVVAVSLSGGAVSPTFADSHAMPSADIQTTVAIQQIEYLRKMYAKATDLIGINKDGSFEEGLAIYRRIFTPDAKISTTSRGVVGFTATGPDGWAVVARDALAEFDDTQHLIGTQLVDIDSLPDAEGKGGEARMQSYLQAWHSDPDRVLFIFLGTYKDKVRYTPGIGWQIYEMELAETSSEITSKE